jgi:hypothetical protein
MEWLATWWPLDFDNISLRVCDIDRGSFAFGAVTGASQSGFHTIGFKLTRVHQLNSIFAIFRVSDHDKALVLKSRCL